ncbi:hypothetical protein TNCT_645791 [Trichonephila clavata]|uniref:Uncharacterized protein n=1 Tax=Trichonephila clavata TaxID=2740835 RepID=A0A8X6F071_TRICU|nr:hypothetical protein TNCT_645791 [Trichonephila clavata]
MFASQSSSCPDVSFVSASLPDDVHGIFTETRFVIHGNLKRRISPKKKRQFRGKESTNKDSKYCSSISTNASSSKIKMPAVFDEEMAEYEHEILETE